MFKCFYVNDQPEVGADDDLQPSRIRKIIPNFPKANFTSSFTLKTVKDY